MKTAIRGSSDISFSPFSRGGRVIDLGFGFGFGESEPPSPPLSLLFDLSHPGARLSGRGLERGPPRPTPAGEGPASLSIRAPFEHDEALVVEVGDQDRLSFDPDLGVVAAGITALPPRRDLHEAILMVQTHR